MPRLYIAILSLLSFLIATKGVFWGPISHQQKGARSVCFCGDAKDIRPPILVAGARAILYIETRV
jgi:hypothetical protein